jgi:predicted phage terminase large subunit-like protein
MLRLRQRRFESAFSAPPAEKPAEIPTDSKIPTEPVKPRNPVLRDDGSPIGIKRYCELVTPAWNWEWAHLTHIDQFLDRVASGEIKRLIIECPPRIGKTEKVNVRFPAYLLELDPSQPFMVAGYNDTFAKRLSRKIRKLLTGRVPLSRDRNSAADWETEAGGGVRAAGVGVGIAGLPAKGIFIDDPVKSHADAYSKAHRDKVFDWYLEDAYTRLEPDGFIVVTMARRHEDDLVGRLVAADADEDSDEAEDKADAEQWVVVRLPSLSEGADDPLGRGEGEALCPERFPAKKLRRMRRKMGDAAFSSLHQQRPAPASGLIFKSDWMRYYTTRAHPIIEDGVAVPFLPDKFVEELQSWDMSFKDSKTSDFVAGHVWSRRGADCYLKPDREHGRMDFPRTIKAVRNLTSRNPGAARKLVEDKANGPAVIATLRSEIPGLIGVEPEGDKVSRAWAVTSIFESGNVWLPHPAIAPWVKGFVLELLQFPLGAHDDDVDACTQALRRLMRNIETEKQLAKRTGGGASIRTYGA